jgi:hypothetical protein
MSDPDEPELPPSAAPSPKTLSSLEPQATMIAPRKSPLAQACMRIDCSLREARSRSVDLSGSYKARWSDLRLSAWKSVVPWTVDRPAGSAVERGDG